MTLDNLGLERYRLVTELPNGYYNGMGIREMRPDNYCGRYESIHIIWNAYQEVRSNRLVGIYDVYVVKKQVIAITCKNVDGEYCILTLFPRNNELINSCELGWNAIHTNWQVRLAILEVGQKLIYNGQEDERENGIFSVVRYKNEGVGEYDCFGNPHKTGETIKFPE